jgi:hypothetical protein
MYDLICTCVVISWLYAVSAMLMHLCDFQTPPLADAALSCRQRHEQYDSDRDLQRMRAALPLIAVWDDHEFTNNAFRTGAQVGGGTAADMVASSRLLVPLTSMHGLLKSTPSASSFLSYQRCCCAGHIGSS